MNTNIDQITGQNGEAMTDETKASAGQSGGMEEKLSRQTSPSESTTLRHEQEEAEQARKAAPVSGDGAESPTIATGRINEPLHYVEGGGPAGCHAGGKPKTEIGVLLDDLVAVLTRHVVLPKLSAEALALWTVHTYGYELREVTAYIGVESPEKRCGKTTLLTVLAEIVNRPVVAANISSPALFRVIQEMQPTLLIDEADTFLKSNEELRGILNSGYTRKTAFVWRAVAQGNDEIRMTNDKGSTKSPGLKEIPASQTGSGVGIAKFSCWCPKIMAAIGRLPETLADRCIVIRMHRKTRFEDCDRTRNMDGSALRRRCEALVAKHAEEIRNAHPEIPEDLNDRAADLWEPLLAIADLAGGDWVDRARRAALALSACEQQNSLNVAFLLELFAGVVVCGKDERVFSREIADWLNSRLGQPWAEGRKGKPVDELWLAQRLRPYGIRSKTMRIGEERAKGYEKEPIFELCQRYVPRSEAQAFIEEMRSERDEPEAAVTEAGTNPN
jgi:hypothetical protein